MGVASPTRHHLAVPTSASACVLVGRWEEGLSKSRAGPALRSVKALPHRGGRGAPSGAPSPLAVRCYPEPEPAAPGGGGGGAEGTVEYTSVGPMLGQGPPGLGQWQCELAVAGKVTGAGSHRSMYSGRSTR